MNYKKGQAAMEFLMTYGWAILVVLAAIGALAYFGVLSPDNFLPSKCTISPQFACKDWKVNEDGTILLQIQNNVGTTVNATVTLEDADCSFVSGGVDTIVTNNTRNGKDFEDISGASPAGLLEFSCDGTLGENDKFATEISILWQEPTGSGLTHTATGSLQTKVEKI